MKCSLCGKPVEDGAAFCPFCGMRLGQEATGAQAGANVPPEAPAPEQQPAAAPGAGTAEGPVPGMGGGTHARHAAVQWPGAIWPALLYPAAAGNALWGRKWAGCRGEPLLRP